MPRTLPLLLLVLCSACAGTDVRPAGDQDQDGVSDDIDRCPGQRGPMANLGCADRDEDRDGVIDRLDSCPSVPGSSAAMGCPDGAVAPLQQVPPPVMAGQGQQGQGQQAAQPGQQAAPQQSQQGQGPPPGDGLARAAQGRVSFTEPVTFEPATPKLTERGGLVLAAAARVIADNPGWHHLLIEGHVDEPGNTAARARALSLQRANEVKQALIRLGVAPERLRTQGFGYSRLIDRSETPAAQKLNNRIEITVVD